MGIAYNTSMVRDGLVLHLDAANKKSYSGTGTAWTDMSGQGKNATLVNSPAFSGNNNGVFLLDGVNDYIDLVSQDDAQTPLSGYGEFTGADTSPFTLEVWLKTTQISGTSATDCPAIIGRNSNDIWANLNLYNGYVYFVHYTTTWELNLKSQTMVSNNVWHHIVYVNNNNETGVLYIDGKAEASGSSSLSGTNYFSPDSVGVGFSTKYLQGNIGVVKFYGRSLTSTEVQKNFNALRGRYGI